MPAPLNAVAVAADGEIVTGAANGSVYFLSPTGERTGEIAGAGIPIIAVALSPDGKRVAAAGIRGAVSLSIATVTRSQALWWVPDCRSGPAIFLADNSPCSRGAATA